MESLCPLHINNACSKRSYLLAIASSRRRAWGMRRYKPLPANGSQIRLVTILPGRGQKKVKCTVEHFPFIGSKTNGPKYEALSYVWGDATITTPITLNSHPFQVTTNLEAALRVLRLKNKKRLIWIDAICINQTSIQERNQEVRRMREIYSRAERVIVWLGPELEPGHATPIDCPGVGKKTHDLLDSLASADPEDCDAAAKILDGTGDPISGLMILNRFFSRPWFSRIWVLQEIALATTATMIYGDHSISWDRLALAVDALRRLQLGLHTHLWRLSSAARMDRVQRCWMRTRSTALREESRSPVHFELADLLWQTRFFEWTEQRDRLYGILGLVGEDLRNEKLLQVDYTKPVADIFRDLTLFMIQGGMLAHVLCSIASSMDGLPSWASTWTADLQGPAASRLSSGISLHMQTYELNGTEPPSNPPRFSADFRRMTIKGSFFDYGISHIGKRFEHTLDSSMVERANLIRSRLIGWEDEMERQDCAHEIFSTLAERREAWKQALLHILPTDESELGRHYDLITNRENELTLAEDNPMFISVVAGLDSTLGRDCDSRRPFITTSGLMGSTGINCELHLGDRVCAFVGLGVPFILRPIDRARSLYQFVGCCWVPGLVDLDLVEGRRKGLWDIQDITLV
ncbi:heterokaryon incompatibility protein-domain-containing protein [Hypoxylon sp. FL1857]|nr:heterokaryon incompatibility protein-domain-containing protein [Hypoxylon sp. FL1857]